MSGRWGRGASEVTRPPRSTFLAARAPGYGLHGSPRGTLPCAPCARAAMPKSMSKPFAARAASHAGKRHGTHVRTAFEETDSRVSRVRVCGVASRQIA